MLLLTNCKNSLEALDKLEESSKREAIRTNGPGILNFTVMSRETAKETQLYPMKIRLQHIALAAFIMVMKLGVIK